MSDVQTAPQKRAYQPRRSAAERAADKREALLESIPQELSAELRERAARQARRDRTVAADVPLVTVRVLKAGDGKISMGLHDSGTGDVHYEWKERFQTTPENALALENRGYVEIEEGDGD